MAQQQQDKKIGFKSIILLKDQNLGIGAYGAVCKVKCDDLLCAAKIIHPTLYDPTAQYQVTPQREHRLPFRRFQLECEFLSAVRHPNVVQYLGTHQDPETKLPVLLMELMEESLTTLNFWKGPQKQSPITSK
jgi:serine/threonine-protein kinase TNNI3K